MEQNFLSSILNYKLKYKNLFQPKLAGFSLIELTLVVAIIGVLSGIAIPMYQTYVINGKLIEARNILDLYKLNTIKHYAKTGSLPSSTDILYPENDLTGKIDDYNKKLSLNHVDQIYAFNGGNYILLGTKLKPWGLITIDHDFLYYAGQLDPNSNQLEWSCGDSASQQNEILTKYRPHNCRSKLP